MNGKGMWMEKSLARSAKLNRDVFERAKRRAVTSPCEYQIQKDREHDQGLYPDEDHDMRSEDAEEDSARLETAFSTTARFMARTTEECEKYYSYKSPSSCNQNEVKHFCRYHSKTAAERLQKPAKPTEWESVPSFTLSPPVGRKNSKDFNIEVHPGTYSISARVRGTERKTQLVNITAGQSVDVLFTV